MSRASNCEPWIQESAWTGSPDALAAELERIKCIPYFQYDSHYLELRKLVVIGGIRNENEQAAPEAMRIRLEYATSYGQKDTLLSDHPIRVFDHDEIYDTKHGHVFPDHRLCLEYRFRKSLSRDPSSAAAEVIGASLLWMIKRNIFERNGGRWPGPEEPHGDFEPLRTLATETARQTRFAATLEPWAQLSIDLRRMPSLDGSCPCGSGKRLRGCHVHLAGLISAAIISANGDGR